MTTVFLYAELDGQALGTFESKNSKHAEDYLIEEISKLNYKANPRRKLVIYLSATPCSSAFNTCKENGKNGCQEKLERFPFRGRDERVRALSLLSP